MLKLNSKLHLCGSAEKEIKMRNMSKLVKVAIESLLMLGFVMSGSVPGFSRDKDETIDDTTFGTGTQLGQNVGVTLNIYQFSTPANR
jgi:hypothetical protein